MILEPNKEEEDEMGCYCGNEDNFGLFLNFFLSFDSLFSLLNYFFIYFVCLFFFFL